MLVILPALLAQGPTFTVLHTFAGTDGAIPTGGLIGDANGNLYGTTSLGGAGGHGVVFKMDSAGNETLLYSFTGGTDGGNPQAGLVRDALGNFYGTTVYGGPSGCPIPNCRGGYGVVFKLDPAGNETALYGFTGGTDGAYPVSDLIGDAQGNLYGTASHGGAFRHGVVFKVDQAGNETVLYAFTGGADGGSPVSALVRDAAGNLYGTTALGGASCPLYRGGCGVVYKLDPAGNETVLYRFTGAYNLDGQRPSARLFPDGAGNLYGASDNAVFKLGPALPFTLVYSFTNLATLFGDLIRDPAGKLFGTAFLYSGGPGIVYRIDPTTQPVILHYFTNGTDGGYPYGGVFRDSAGNLYGTASSGGNTTPICQGAAAPGCGVVFKVTP